MFSESQLQTGKGFSYLLGTGAPNQGLLKHSTLGMPEDRTQGRLEGSTGLTSPHYWVLIS